MIKQEKVNYRKYSKVMDNVRRHLSSFEAKPEHAIKKGDPELIALVIQLFEEKQEKVFVSTFDKGLLKALKPFSDKVEYEVMKSNAARHRLAREQNFDWVLCVVVCSRYCLLEVLQLKLMCYETCQVHFFVGNQIHGCGVTRLRRCMLRRCMLRLRRLS